MENLAYALVQLVHNFGAAAVTGGAIAAWWPSVQPPHAQRRLAWLVAGAWIAQFASGALFGVVSFAWYGQFPDIAPPARVALVVKLLCAFGGVALVAALLLRGQRWTEPARLRAWRALAGFGVVALAAAAFLRWFS